MIILIMQKVQTFTNQIRCNLLLLSQRGVRQIARGRLQSLVSSATFNT